MIKKKKTYVLTVSQYFPVKHVRSGEETNFERKLLRWLKKHTIRANYELWKKRIEEVNSGLAVLSIRKWSGKPYQSKQVEIMRLDETGGLGVQKLWLMEDGRAQIEDEGNIISIWLRKNRRYIPLAALAKNDGLNLPDFREWFRDYDRSKPMAVIQFTKFRY
jgi:hypothetical protein